MGVQCVDRSSNERLYRLKLVFFDLIYFGNCAEPDKLIALKCRNLRCILLVFGVPRIH